MTILISCIIFIQSSIVALEVDDLFEISIPVEDQSDSKRKIATRQALIKVMVRISGQSSAESNNLLNSRLKNASSYIQRYLYRKVDKVDEQGKSIEQIILDLVFDEMSLRNLLRETSLPLWGANRPQVLFWIAIGDSRRQFLMGTDDESLLNTIMQEGEDTTNISTDAVIASTDNRLDIDLKKIINDQASSRGLPILIPLMDLEDSININILDVWGRYIEPIRQASVRYNSDTIVAAQIKKVDNIWITQWLLLHKRLTLSWEQESNTIEDALSYGIDSVTDKIAEQYAVYEDNVQQNELLISVTNVNRVEDFAYLMEYLEKLISIQSVNVNKVHESTIQLRVKLVGKEESLIQAISLNNKLRIEREPIIEVNAMVTDLPTLYFRWNTES